MECYSGVWILVGEMFDTRTRAKQGSLSTAANWAWNFLLAFFTPSINGAINYRFAYVPAGMMSYALAQYSTEHFGYPACNLIGALVVHFFLCESAELSLEDVNEVCVFSLQ